MASSQLPSYAPERRLLIDGRHAPCHIEGLQRCTETKIVGCRKEDA